MILTEANQTVRIENQMPSNIPKVPIPPRPLVFKQTSHNMNILACILTAGLWIPAYILIVWDVERQNRKREVAFAEARAVYEYRYHMYQREMQGL